MSERDFRRRQKWTPTQNNADDQMVEAYKRCSEGADPPSFMRCDGRTLRAFGILAPDDELDNWFEMRPDKPIRMVK